MNTPNPLDTQTDLSRVLEKITEIAEKSAGDDYIYRGESKCHKKVSSNLYREYETDIEAENFDIAVVQDEILREAKEYTHQTDEFEILTELQHYGGKTNLIDFTTDYLVALFFACDGNHDEPGRVILLKNQSETYEVVKPSRTIARAGIQKGIFVQAPGGVVEPDIVVCIPADLKGDMLEYLRKHHDISTKTIYNDLQGFIENRRTHKSAYTEFYKGFTCKERWESTRDPVEKQKWYDKAIAHYTEAVDLNPEHVNAYNNRGATYGKMGDWARVLQDCNTAINLDPEGSYAYINRGVAYRKLGDFDRAIQDFNKAIELNPEYAEGYNNRGNAYTDKGEFDRAIQDYDRTIQLKPTDTEGYNNRGTAYYHKGDFDTAIQDYNTAIELNPEYAEAYNNRGLAYDKLGDFDIAIQDYNKAIDRNPEYTEAYRNQGIAYHKKGEFDKAIQDYNTAIELNPEYADAYYSRGIAYWNKGDFDIAIQDFNKTIGLNPQYAQAYSNRGKAWLHLKEWEKAKVDLSTAKDMVDDIVASFHIDYKSVEDFEAKHGVKVPADIAALLRRD